MLLISRSTVGQLREEDAEDSYFRLLNDLVLFFPVPGFD